MIMLNSKQKTHNELLINCMTKVNKNAKLDNFCGVKQLPFYLKWNKICKIIDRIRNETNLKFFYSLFLQAKLLENSAWLGASPSNIAGELISLNNNEVVLMGLGRSALIYKVRINNFPSFCCNDSPFFLLSLCLRQSR